MSTAPRTTSQTLQPLSLNKTIPLLLSLLAQSPPTTNCQYHHTAEVTQKQSPGLAVLAGQEDCSSAPSGQKKPAPQRTAGLPGTP